jgi:hypothetical protein
MEVILLLQTPQIRIATGFTDIHVKAYRDNHNQSKRLNDSLAEEENQ